MPKGGGGTGASGGSSLPTVKLGKGDNTYVVTNTDQITKQIVDAQQGSDTLDLRALTQGIYLTATNYTGGSQQSVSSLSLDGYKGIAGYDWSWGYSNYSGPQNIVSNTIKGFENFLLGSGNDWLALTDAADNLIDGGGGNDVLTSGFGADKVIGGIGSDWLSGDIEHGGVVVGGEWDGNPGQLPTGDGESDTFSSGIILDFEPGIDRLQVLVHADGVQNYLHQSHWQETSWNGHDAVELIVEGFRTSFRLVGISLEDASDITLSFTIGAEGVGSVIEGGAGDDVIHLGPGSDTFVLWEGAGHDTVVYDSRYFDLAQDKLAFRDGPPANPILWEQDFVNGQEAITYHYSATDSVTILGLTLADASSIQFA